MRIKLITALVLAGLIPSAAEAVPTQPFAIFTIGDSLSDTGNLSIAEGLPPRGIYFGDAAAFDAASPPGSEPLRRYSDGPVWIERLEQRLGGTPGWNSYIRADWERAFGAGIDELLGLPIGSTGVIQSSDPKLGALGSSFAFGGAQTDNVLFGGISSSLVAQAAEAGGVATRGAFVAPPTSDQIARSLFVVQGGGNDFFKITNPSDAPSILQTAVDNLAQIITDLAGDGAEHILVPNLPGYAVADDWLAANPADIRTLSAGFNALLASELDALRATLGVDIYEVDWFGLFDDMLADPANFGLANTDAPCADFDASSVLESLCSDPASYLMFDALHPSSTAHQAMADAAWDALAGFNPGSVTGAVPEPATALLMLATLGWVRRRNAAPRAASPQ